MSQNMRFLMAVVGCLSLQNLAWAESVDNNAFTVKQLSKEARAIIKPFAKDLQQTLKTTLQIEGPIAAIQVCHSDAAEIAKKYSSDGWVISRTALKARNSTNTPDEWERETLLAFEQRLLAGEAASTLEATQQTPTEFRYMKAIPTGEVCTVCHGVELAPAVSSAIDVLYSEDKARGFSVGDIRGAFSLRKILSTDQ